MSAFLISDESLQVIVYASLNTRHGMRWGKGRELRRLDYEGADRVIRMLRAENVKSLEARYPNDPEMWADAPLSYIRTLAFSTEPTPVEILKTIHCYEYQACEHDGWKDSEAHAFCRALESDVIRDLPGYDNCTGWDWTAEEFKKRRGGVICLSGLMGQKRGKA